MTNQKPRELTRLKSTVEDFEDIEWKTDTGNSIVDNAIVNDDLTLTITFKKKKYVVRSPDRRLVNRFKKLRGVKKLTEDQAFEMDEVQEELIHDMIPKFDIRAQRVSEQEFDEFSALCWRYYAFSKKKSIVLARDYST